MLMNGVYHVVCVVKCCVLKWLAHRKTSDVLENFEVFTQCKNWNKEGKRNDF